MSFRWRPSGLLNWRYFLYPRGGDPRVRAHRRLWLAARRERSAPVWLAAEMLRWAGWLAWRGPDLIRRWQADSSTGRAGHRRRALASLVRGWCIPPREALGFGLDRRPEQSLDFVYDAETDAFHRLMSGPTKAADDGVRFLRDKLRACEELGRTGVPVAPVLACIPKGSDRPIAGLLEGSEPLFFKMRSGHAARHAFTAWRGRDGVAGKTAHGVDLPSEGETERAWRTLLAHDDGLVQPLLSNHPEIAPLSPGGELITVRYISVGNQGEFSCYCAVMEVPEPGSGQTALVALESETGAFLPWPQDAPGLPLATELPARARARAPGLKAAPHWDTIQAMSHLAHAQVPALWAVAWDWALTPDGPLLLEGNSGWGLAIPQILRGEPLALRLPAPRKTRR